MTAKPRKNRDPNVTAFDTVQQFLARNEPQPAPVERLKNPAAVALGRLGGLKGGKARAESLSKSERSAIATKAAVARWKAEDQRPKG